MTQPVQDLDPFAGSGEKNPSLSFKDKPFGTVYTGTVVETPKRVQATDFETGKPKVWPDGNIAYTVVTTLEINGERFGLWAAEPSSMFGALGDAQRAAKARISIGGTLTVTLVGEKPDPDNPRKNPQKLYTASYTPADAFAPAALPVTIPAPAAPTLPYVPPTAANAGTAPVAPVADGATLARQIHDMAAMALTHEQIAAATSQTLPVIGAVLAAPRPA